LRGDKSASRQFRNNCLRLRRALSRRRPSCQRRRGRARAAPRRSVAPITRCAWHAPCAAPVTRATVQEVVSGAHTESPPCRRVPSSSPLLPAARRHRAATAARRRCCACPQRRCRATPSLRARAAGASSTMPRLSSTSCAGRSARRARRSGPERASRSCHADLCLRHRIADPEDGRGANDSDAAHRRPSPASAFAAACDATAAVAVRTAGSDPPLRRLISDAAPDASQ